MTVTEPETPVATSGASNRSLAASMGRPTADRRRPGPLRWLHYALGGALPARNSTWVLHDVTTRTWVLRHVARTLVQLAVPVAVVMLALPGPLWLRFMSALSGVILGLAFSLAYMTETIENRARKAGYPVGSAQAGRDRAAAERLERERERRRAAAARRAARYRAGRG